MKRLCALLSGGKDSIYATYIAMISSRNVVCGLSIIANKDSWMFHIPFINQMNILEEVIQIPIIRVKTNGEKEKELVDLKRGLIIAKKKYHIDGVVTGAVLSEYQRMRINLICDDLKLDVFNPLWHKDNKEILIEESNILDFIIVSIAGEGLKREWIGKIVKERIVSEILNSKIINPIFEGGEAETLVLDAPFFKKRIEIKNQRIIKESDYNYNLIGELTSINKKIRK